MKKNFSTKLISLLMAVLMVVTMLPLSAFTVFAAGSSETGYQWTEIASTDFTSAGGSTWTADSAYNENLKETENQGAVLGMGGTEYFFRRGGFRYVQNSSQSANWTLAEYATDGGQTGDYKAEVPNPFDPATQVTENGVSLRAGYMFLSNYGDNSKTPVTGLKEFKIAVDFMFTSDNADSVTERDKTCFFKISTNPNTMVGKSNETMWSNNFFAQDSYGRSHIAGNATTSAEGTTYGVDRQLTTANSKLSPNVKYTYEFKYINGFISAAVLDASGNQVMSCGYGQSSAIDPNAITGIYLGDSNNTYYANNICYNKVTFYSGSSTVEHKQVDSAKDKYLFAYFTGNDDQNVRLAVSDDGYNFEALNGNIPVLKNAANNCYPSSTTNSQIPASNSARDPFIFPKNNGNGYYAIATDLDINAQYGYSNTKFLVWDIDNLGDIGEVTPWNIETSDWFNNYSNIYSDTKFDYVAWAPEAIWDVEAGMYMMYWTGPMIYQNGNKWESNAQKRLYYAYTDDFKTFYTDPTKSTELGNGVEPNMLFDCNFTSIDANITYDGNLYYMYYKNEDEKQIYYAVSDHANGPWAGPKKFYDSAFANKHIEGCEVYQLYNGSYTLMADCYVDDYKYDGYFIMYNSTELLNFEHNNANSRATMNYLTPRHGCVVNITTDEYNSLVNKYGKITIDTDTPLTGDVNDYIVARYFTTNDVTKDATNHGYTLTNNNVTYGQEEDGRIYANFANNNIASSQASSNQYAYLDQATLKKMIEDNNMNGKDGFTIDWYGYVDSSVAYTTENQPIDFMRFIEFTTVDPGTITDFTNAQYIYYGTKNGYGVSNGVKEEDCWGYSQNAEYNSTGKWRRYTLNLSHNYVSLWVDGQFLGKQWIYKDVNDEANRLGNNGGTGAAGSESSGSPTFFDYAAGDWFDAVFKSGKLLIGASSFQTDNLLNGKISDLRIYSKAISPKQVNESVYKLEHDEPGEFAQDLETDRVFFDPMEAIDGTNYVNYNNTVDDPLVVNVNDVPTPINGKVLSVGGSSQTAQYNTGSGNADKTIKSQIPDFAMKDDGVTFAFLYNPGNTITAEDKVVTVGNDNIVLYENGKVTFNDGTNSFTIDNAFGDSTLGTDKWNHIVLQIAKTDTGYSLYTYISGKLAKKNAMETIYSSKPTVMYDYAKANIAEATYTYGSGGTGYIERFSIYNGLYNANSLLNEFLKERIIPNIEVMKNEYLAKMAAIDGTFVYTNMEPAYEAYDTILRYQDSVRYGDTIEEKELLVTYYFALKDAIAAMEKYTGPETIEGFTQQGVQNVDGDSNPLGEKSDVTIPKEYTQNMMTVPDLTIKQEQDGGTQNELNTRVYQDTFVWLYDGVNTPTAPISSGYYKQAAATWNYYYIDEIHVDSTETNGANDAAPVISLGGLGLGGENDLKWHSQNTVDLKWYYNDANVYFSTKAKDSSLRYQIPSPEQEWRVASSYLTFNGTIDDNTYLLTIKPTYGTQGHREWPINKYASYNRIIYAPDIYVINYAPIKAQLFNDSNINTLKTVDNYAPSSVKDMLTAYDKLTGQTYAVDNINDNAINEIANSIKTANEELKTAVSETNLVEKADYTGLKESVIANQEEIDKGNTVVEEGTNTQTQYTTSSWNNYQNAVNSAVESFTNLDPDTVNDPYKTQQADVDTYNDAILNAKDDLVVVADYQPVDNAVVDSSDEYNNGIGTLDAQNYAYYTWASFENAYEVADPIHQETIDTRNDTPKYDVSGNYSSADQSTWTTESEKQTTIRTSASNLETARNGLAPVDSDSAYETYNAAQNLSLKVDRTAYSADGLSAIDANLALGYVAQNGTPIAPEYTDGTSAVYVTAPDGNVYKNTTTNQTDPKTRNVLETINVGEGVSTDKLNKYAVTLVYDIDGTKTNISTTYHYYGEEVTLNYTDAGTVVSWNVAQNGASTVIKNNTATYTLPVRCDSIVTVSATTETVGKCVVTVKDYFNRSQVVYVDANTTATLGDMSIAFSNGQTVDVPNCNYMTFNKWVVNNQDHANGDVVTITEDTVINANGTKPQDTITYTVEGGKFADGSTETLYKVDDVVTITADSPDAIGIAMVTPSGDKFLAYGSTYTFYAFPKANALSDTVSFKIVTADRGTTDPDSFGVGIMNNDKLSMYCLNTINNPDTVKIVERGVLLSRTATTPETMIKGANGVTALPSTTSNDATQYMITVKLATPAYARTYVSYEIKVDDIWVPMVAYGDVVYSADC